MFMGCSWGTGTKFTTEDLKIAIAGEPKSGPSSASTFERDYEGFAGMVDDDFLRGLSF